jgi:hypothetical protein
METAPTRRKPIYGKKITLGIVGGIQQTFNECF